MSASQALNKPGQIQNSPASLLQLGVVQDGSLQNPYIEPNYLMESSSKFPATFALTSVSGRPSNSSTEPKGWNSFANIFQLFPTNQPTTLRPEGHKLKELDLDLPLFARTQAQDADLLGIEDSDIWPGRDRTTAVSPLEKKYDSIRYFALKYFALGSSGNGPVTDNVTADVLFAVVPRDDAYDSSRDPDSTVNDRGPTRAFYRPDKDIWTLSRRPGIVVETYPDGDDLILPNGPGGRWIDVKQGGFDPDSYPNVDRSQTFVNSRDGDDVVIGGFGTDYFGAADPAELLAAKDNWKNMGNFRPALEAQGSKFFVGGSEADVLIGGKSADYLVGDRYSLVDKDWAIQNKGRTNDDMNTSPAAEVYITTKPNEFSPKFNLDDLPSTKHVKAINAYQPTNHYKLDSSKINTTRWNTSTRNKRGKVSTKYPTWIPGNDILFSGDGPDVIYGDDTSPLGIDANLNPLVIMKNWAKGYNTNDGNHYLYYDERLSGLTWPDLFTSTGVRGTLGSDFINAGAGSDFIYAGFGADSIIGGADSDYIDCGPQIAVPGYVPFFGPKVVFGDNAVFDKVLMKWIKEPDLTKRSADHFVIGNLYLEEKELGLGDAPPELEPSARESFTQSLQAVSNFAALAGIIPPFQNVTDAIQAITAIFNLFPPPAPKNNGTEVSTLKPEEMDVSTIIRDFDPFDTFTIRVKSGQSIRANRMNKNIPLVKPSSKLLDGDGDSYNGVGTQIYVSEGAAGSLPRLFLEGYTENRLVQLNKKVIGDYAYVTYGGTFYDALDPRGNRAFESILINPPPTSLA